MTVQRLPADDPERLAAARPWRQRMWDRIPGWARIGLISGAVLAAIHVAAAFRIWYGLQDPPAVVALQRNPTTMVTYRVEPIDATSDIFNWFENLAIGLRGRSVDDVESIMLGCEFAGQMFDGKPPTDMDIAYVARHFPKLEHLEIMNGACSSQGLMALKRCPQLLGLTIHNMDVDDGLAELLPHLPQLYSLHVNYANTGNGLVAAAIDHKRLLDLDVDGTNATQAAIDAWIVVRPPGTIRPTVANTGMDSFYRWSDGSATWFLPHQLLMEIQGPFDATATNSWPRKTLRSLGNFTAWISPDELESYNDGTYRVLISLVLNRDHSPNDDDWELLVSEPAEFEVMNGVSRSRLEIHLPITRVEAMRRIPHDGAEAVDQWIDALLTREGVTSPRDRRHRKIPRR